MNTMIECTTEALALICAEADREYFGTAADLGLCFCGGFDHADVARNGWSVKLHDRGVNRHFHDFTFRVPAAQRAGKRGPAQ